MADVFFYCHGCAVTDMQYRKGDVFGIIQTEGYGQEG